MDTPSSPLIRLAFLSPAWLVFLFLIQMLNIRVNIYVFSVLYAAKLISLCVMFNSGEENQVLSLH